MYWISSKYSQAYGIGCTQYISGITKLYISWLFNVPPQKSPARKMAFIRGIVTNHHFPCTEKYGLSTLEILERRTMHIFCCCKHLYIDIPKNIYSNVYTISYIYILSMFIIYIAFWGSFAQLEDGHTPEHLSVNGLNNPFHPLVRKCGLPQGGSNSYLYGTYKLSLGPGP